MKTLSGFLLLTLITLCPAADTLLSGKVKLKDASGSTLLAFKGKSDGAKVVDGNEAEVARLKVSSSGKIRIKDSADTALGAVEGQAGKWRLVDDTDSKQFVLQQQADGDWKVEDADERLMFTLKKRDYGWKVEDDDGTERWKAKIKGAKVKLYEVPGDTLIAESGDGLSALALGLWPIEAIPLPQRAALMLRLHASNGAD
jgi:hypothetical protein